MELLAELDPPRDPRKLLSIAKELSKHYHWIDIPDAPLGKPNYSSPIVSTYLAAHGYSVISHLRTLDVNTIALKTITKTMGSLGVKRIVYLRGDPPQQGSTINDFTPEDAVYYARSRPEAPEPGLLISLRKPLPAIKYRLEIPAGFYLILNYDWYTASNKTILKEMRKITSDKKFYVYAIAKENCDLWIKDIIRGIEHVHDMIDGILISSPANPSCIIRAGSELGDII